MELGQERVLQLDAGLLLKRFEGFWLIGESSLKVGLTKLRVDQNWLFSGANFEKSIKIVDRHPPHLSNCVV